MPRPLPSVTLVLAAAACVATLAMRWALAEPPAAAPPTLAQAAIPTPGPVGAWSPRERCTTDLAGAEVRSRIEEVQQRLAEIADLRTLLEGDPLPWPEEPDPRLEPVALEQAAREAIAVASRDMRLVRTDCQEYPCIIVVDDTELVYDRGTSGRAGSALMEALKTDPNYADVTFQGLGWLRSERDGDHNRVAVAIFPPPLTLDQQVRTQMRIAEMRILDANAPLEQR